MTNRDEYLAKAKGRALAHLDRGELEEAFTSMCIDMSRHTELEGICHKLDRLGLLYTMNKDVRQLRYWIEGFR